MEGYPNPRDAPKVERISDALVALLGTHLLISSVVHILTLYIVYHIISSVYSDSVMSVKPGK